MSREREAESEENHVSREREAESEEGGSAVAERAHDRSFRAPDRVLVVERDHAQRGRIGEFQETSMRDGMGMLC